MEEKGQCGESPFFARPPKDSVPPVAPQLAPDRVRAWHANAVAK